MLYSLTPALLLLTLCLPSTRPAATAATDRNAQVLAAARAFPDGGTYRVKWSEGTGCPVEISHNGTRILAKDPSATYCCGYTFAVVIKVLEDNNLLANKSPAELKAFQKAWYGATKDSSEKLVVPALIQLGLGHEVSANDAKPGDFLQIWRTDKSGHSVVFLGWTETNGKRTGFKYRSSQKSTNGIGDKEETLDSAGGKVVTNRMYFARLNP